MASVVATCPHCGKEYPVPETASGRRTTCKVCGGKFVIGDASAGVPPTSLSRPASPPPPSPPPAPPRLVAAKERPRGEDGIPLNWEPGDVILDLYEVVALPGTERGYAEGGMGRVNLVRHRTWGRELAVKSVLPAKSASVRDIEAFQAEAEQWVDKIGLHPNVVACHYVRALGGVPRVFLDYVEGGTLQEWVKSKRLYEGGHGAALERILDVAIQTAWGLHYVHELGLIHQDVKPLNVMMTSEGVAKVTDFGLAGGKALAAGELAPGSVGQSLYATGAGMMTPAYCSPEQADIQAMKKGGVPPERWPKLTRRTDVWSWAVSVLHLFLGKVCWPAGQVAHFALSREPDEAYLPAMPEVVKEVVRGCLQKREEDRPRDLMQLVEALRDIFERVTGKPHPREVPRPEDLLADGLNNRAVSLIDLTNREAAEKKWKEALRVDPHHAVTIYNWGLTQWRANRITDQKLLENLREVRTSAADPARVDYLTGLIHLERSDALTAVEVLNQAAATGAERKEVALALSQARSLAGPTGHGARSFAGHEGEVLSVSWGGDGSFALSGSSDGTVRLWETATGNCLQIFYTGHQGAVTSVALSPIGTLAVSGGHDKAVRVWKVDVAKPPSDDSAYRKVLRRIWSAAAGSCLFTLEGHTDVVTSVAWAHSGFHAISGSRDGTVRLWKSSNGECDRVFEGDGQAVSAIAWGGYSLKFVFSGYSNGTIRQWEESSGNCLHAFMGHEGEVTSLACSPDGRLILSGSKDKTVRLWEVSSGHCRCIFTGHSEAVTSVAWSDDGRFALTSSGDTTIRLWDVSTGLCLRVVGEHPDAVTSMSWEPRGGRRALTGCGDKLVRVWQVSGAAGLPAWVGHTAGVTSVACSPDGRFALTGSMDKTVRLWEAPAGKCLRVLEGHTDHVSSVAWSPDGRLALSGSWDKTLRLWEVSTGKCLRVILGHEDGVSRVTWGGDGRLVFTLTKQGRARHWNASTWECHGSYHVQIVATGEWSPDGRFILCPWNRNANLYEFSSKKYLGAFEGHADHVDAVAWSPDGRNVLTAGVDKTVRLWDSSTRECLGVFDTHGARVESLSCSPDGRLVFLGANGNLGILAIPSGRLLRSVRGHESISSRGAWSPDGRFVTFGSGGDKVRSWAVATPDRPAPLLTSGAIEGDTEQYRKLLRQARTALSSDAPLSADLLKQARQLHGCSRRQGALELAAELSRRLPHRRFVEGWERRVFWGHESAVASVAWSPDGRFALSGSGDKTIRLWDVSTGECLRTFAGDNGHVYSVSWGPDNRFVLSASTDNTVRHWEVSSGQCLRTFKGHTGNVICISPSPDGKFALSGSSDFTIRRWEVFTGKCLGVWEDNETPEPARTGFSGYVTSVAWSPDGRHVLTANRYCNRLLEATTGRTLRTINTGSVSVVLWSPLGNVALMNGPRETIVLVDVASGKELRAFYGHTDVVTSMSWSPDGRFALSGSNDKTVRLWAVSTGACLRVFEGHEAGVSSVSFSPNGRHALSGGVDKVVRLWELDWEFEPTQPADWDDGARPFLNAFLTLQASSSAGKPSWTDDDFRRLLDRLGCAGFGWLRPDGVRRELDNMAAAWQGPPPLGS